MHLFSLASHCVRSLTEIWCVLVVGTNLDAALSAYPCRPCNYAVSDLDDLDPVAEETLGAALKERLAYSAVAVVFDCGSNSPVEYEMLFTLPELSLAGFHVGAAGAIGLPLHSLATFDAACGGEAGTTMGELPAECAPSGSTPAIFPGSDGGGAVPNRVCGPVTLAIAMQFLNACNGGDFALARCAFSPAVAGALDTATLGSLYEDHACEQPDGFRMERSNGMVRPTTIECKPICCSFVLRPYWKVLPYSVSPHAVSITSFDNNSVFAIICALLRMS
eukprot:COSAG02_NODE_1010_length_15227_cov_5.846774_3_plen_277_part_00